jgi:hypothetical protein
MALCCGQRRCPRAGAKFPPWCNGYRVYRTRYTLHVRGIAACSGRAFNDAPEQRRAGFVQFRAGLQVGQRAGALPQIFERDAFA